MKHSRLCRFSFRLLMVMSLPCVIAAQAAEQNVAVSPPEHLPGSDIHESGTTITPAIAAASGIRIATAGPAELRQVISLYGRITSAAGSRSVVAAPFAGIVQSVAVQEGDTVHQGDPLVTVHNSDSLQIYTIRAPITGVVARRHVDPGMFAGAEPLVILLNLERVWAMLSAFPSDLDQLKTGQPAQVRTVFGQQAGEAPVAYIAPTAGPGQATAIRLVLDNPDRKWRPGQAVQAAITIARVNVPIAVVAEAVQTVDGKPTVFVREGQAFAAREVRLGRRDGSLTEIVSGLETGDRYVASNSFLVKADILKSGAGHDH